LFLRRREDDLGIPESVAIGSVAGLLASFAYDIARFPFAMAGTRVFGTISVFGVWLLDAQASSRYTEAAGWLYHYWNGISFGIMYALFARGRHWFWAIVWACLLETLAIVSPFGTIFHVAGDAKAMAIAYWGHVAYGYPLGVMVRDWDRTSASLTAMPNRVRWALVVIACAIVGGYLTGVEPPPAARQFRIDATHLHPDWLRINRGDTVRFHNPGPGPVVVVSSTKEQIPVAPSQDGSLRFAQTGIHQLFVQTDQLTHSSFVIVEPVELRN